MNRENCLQRQGFKVWRMTLQSSIEVDPNTRDSTIGNLPGQQQSRTFTEEELSYYLSLLPDTIVLVLMRWGISFCPHPFEV